MNRKVCVVFVLLWLSVFAVSSIIVRGASQVELTPTSGEPDDSVTVEGTDFAATSKVGICLGPEALAVTGELHEITNVTIGGPDVYGPFVARTLHYPIKPGSFYFLCDVSDVTSEYFDDYGNGTLNTTSTYALDPFVNYVTGEFGRSASSSWETYTVTFTAAYTYYEFNVTPAAGVTTDGSGAFTADITVPAIWNGTSPVTVIDEAGNIATADFTVEGSDVPTIPEALTVGTIVLLSSTALVVSFYWLRKKTANKMLKYS
jgi:hypothetical protein